MKQYLTSILVTITLAGIGQGQTTDLSTVASDGSTYINVAALLGQLADGPKGTLTENERKGLLWMREEEKLARDVYDVLAIKWGGRPFSNITRSEQTHMDAVKTLLDRHSIADPAATTKPGQFKDPTLQKLYDKLVKSGSLSRTKALQVGAQIEDLDLFDLERWLKLTENSDIKLVYANLEKGSRNHLRAFVSSLKMSGGTYKPMYISQSTFDKIIAAPMERGPGRRGGA